MFIFRFTSLLIFGLPLVCSQFVDLPSALDPSVCFTYESIYYTTVDVIDTITSLLPTIAPTPCPTSISTVTVTVTQLAQAFSNEQVNSLLDLASRLEATPTPCPYIPSNNVINSLVNAIGVLNVTNMLSNATSIGSLYVSSWAIQIGISVGGAGLLFLFVFVPAQFLGIDNSLFVAYTAVIIPAFMAIFGAVNTAIATRIAPQLFAA
uniref:Uncharacterized protein n=1 Tax=Ophiognomonia clavigignenti-juglandacearum TaxID=218668 RepID=A0A291LJ29_9PEZI|nr:hypothetical protein [Ophiognomonia clavigignenti-juglandacearum]